MAVSCIGTLSRKRETLNYRWIAVVGADKAQEPQNKNEKLQKIQKYKNTQPPHLHYFIFYSTFNGPSLLKKLKTKTLPKYVPSVCASTGSPILSSW